MKTLAMVMLAALAMTAAVPVSAEPAATPIPSPQKLAMAKKLMEVSGGKGQATLIVNAMFQGLNQGLDTAVPAEQVRLMRAVRDDMQAEIIGMVPALVDISVQLYAQDFTEKELKDYLAWLESDSGQSIKLKVPALTRQMADAETPLIKAMIPRMSQKVIDRVCSEMQCSPQDREFVAQTMAKAMQGQHAS